MFEKLGLRDETRVHELYLCEPTPGLGFVVWWGPVYRRYHIQPVGTQGSASIYEAWINTSSGLTPRGTYAAHAEDPLTVLAIINHQTTEYLKEIANDERILAAARAADARDAAKRKSNRAAC